MKSIFKKYSYLLAFLLLPILVVLNRIVTLFDEMALIIGLVILFIYIVVIKLRKTDDTTA
jgi:hypothetical protein